MALIGLTSLDHINIVTFMHVCFQCVDVLFIQYSDPETGLVEFFVSC